MANPSRPVTHEHDIVGAINPRCRRCQRTVIDLVLHPAPCRPVPVKADLIAARAAEVKRSA